MDLNKKLHRMIVVKRLEKCCCQTFTQKYFLSNDSCHDSDLYGNFRKMPLEFFRLILAMGFAKLVRLRDVSTLQC